MNRLYKPAVCHQLFRFVGGHHDDLQILGGIEMLFADPLTVCDQIQWAKLLIHAAFGATLQRNTGSLPA